MLLRSPSCRVAHVTVVSLVSKLHAVCHIVALLNARTVLPEDRFVTCKVCPDYDLCLPCHAINKHGHHPAHSFQKTTPTASLTALEESLLDAGRNVRHHATCDGCDANIYGVRHKCFNCPDFDYCSKCVEQSAVTHPGHRFATLYEPISFSSTSRAKHYGVYCDGVACTSKSKKSYIEGVRYKCVICHDTDFCADCEAAPGATHNATHPLLKIKRPIRGLNISTINERHDGQLLRNLGDRRPERETKTDNGQPSPVSTVASPSSVSLRTVADIKPRASPSSSATVADRSPFPLMIPPPHGFPAHVAMGVTPSPWSIPLLGTEPHTGVVLPKISSTSLQAHFVRDTIADGSVVRPGQSFTQVWTLRNSGPKAWPAGCSVRYVGGDNMLNIDESQWSSAAAVAEATETTIVGRDVQPNEQVAFKIQLKAPVRQGRAISYWHLKTAEGRQFQGVRLWCDVNVMAEAPVAVPGTAAAIRESLEAQTESSAHSPFTTFAPGSGQLSPQHLDVTTAGDDAESRTRYEMIHERLRAECKRLFDTQGPVSADPVTPSLLPTTQSTSRTFEATQRRNPWTTARQLHEREQTGKMSAGTHRMPESSSPNVEASTAGSAPRKASLIHTAKDSVKIYPTRIDNVKDSQMIYPTLDKESPSSSAYHSADSASLSKGKAAYVEDEETQTVVAEATKPRETSVASSSSSEATPESVARDDFEDLSNEIEVLSAASEMSEDDGFLTDEEYDILDASDQETVASSK